MYPPVQLVLVYWLSSRPSAMQVAMNDDALPGMHLPCGSVSVVHWEHLSSEHVRCWKVLPLDGAGVDPGAGVGLGPGPLVTTDVQGRLVIRHWSVPFSTRM
jgi:hypothetical protein